MTSVPITSWQIDGETWKQWQTLFWGVQNHCRWWLQPWNRKTLTPWRKVMTNLDSVLKSRDITLPTKVHLVKAMDYKESWAPNNWCFWTMVLEKILESPLDCKEIQPVHPKGNQPWMFIGRTDVEAETPILWAPDAKSWLIAKGPDAGKVWRQEEKGTTEDEMVGWHHRLNGHEFESTPGVVMDMEAWHAVVHGISKSWTWLSNRTELTEY